MAIWIAVGWIVSLIAVGGAGYLHGKNVCEGDHAKAQVVEEAKDRAVVGVINKGDAKADEKSAAKTKAREAKKDVVIKEVIRHVQVLPDPVDCHLDDQRVRNINAALDDALPDPAVEAPVVPRPEAAEKREPQRRGAVGGGDALLVPAVRPPTR